ncbi:NERD domain-containing protein [Virgibacillus sp. W0430]|uniref:NERD domain-containing protein n=1 Tax=Virgibacillus sp. W0430 TaxID=3391580 RepID=UPI003F48EFAF
MAQLIKLEDYVSRYEWNVYRYPSQYIRLKRENWKKLVQRWQNEQDANHRTDKEMQSEEGGDLKHPPLPTTNEKLKQYFLDELYPIQLKWATSTVTDVSFTSKNYEKDNLLKYFLQRFPDIYLIMYYPVFNIQKAPIEGEIIVISPIGIEIINILEIASAATIMASSERTWRIDNGNGTFSKQISPLISLKRSEQIIKAILQAYNIEFPVKKTVLSRTNHILFATESYQTRIVGKRQYDQWFKEKRQLSGTLKSVQLKAIEALLKHCQTTSVKRPEWAEETSTFSFDE